MKEHAARAVAVMQSVHALDISMYDPSFLVRTLEKHKARLPCVDYEEYFTLLQGSGVEAHALQGDLLVNYSEFFRSPLSCAVLEQVVLPGLAEQKMETGRGLRVWSAGCAAGQEAYTIAMLLEEIALMRARPLQYHITATDINEKALEMARAGIYDEQALENVRLRFLRAFFEPRGTFYHMKASIRDKVDFSYYDVLDTTSAFPPAAVFGNLDVILCCNLLYYYRVEMQKAIIDKLRKALAPGGFLVVDESEKDIVQKQGGFVTLGAYHAVFYKLG